MHATRTARSKIGTLDVSLVGVGCNNFGWRIDANQTARVVCTALDSGINFFDTADIYDSGRSEQFLGQALTGRRQEAVIATKCGAKFDDTHYGAKPEYIRHAAEVSLRRLSTDYIDLYQIHEPDPNTPIDETLGALDDLVREGKVREIGCSNFSTEQIREAERSPIGRTIVHPRFASVQNEYSLLNREAESDVLPECDRLGMAFLPYFPLANGLLSGKYRRGQSFPTASRAADGFGPEVFTPDNLDKVEDLIRFATVRGHSLLELAFSWLVAQPLVASVISGAVSPEQVRSNAAAPIWKLNPADLNEINRLLPPRL
jgi:aryl-alcohol dehydrogenase-like predicted oxidoreductase